MGYIPSTLIKDIQRTKRKLRDWQLCTLFSVTVGNFGLKKGIHFLLWFFTYKRETSYFKERVVLILFIVQERKRGINKKEKFNY